MRIYHPQADVRVCFSCQQLGHLAKDYPTPSGAVSSSASALHAVRPKAARASTTTRSIAERRVFTTSALEATQATDLIQGTAVVAGIEGRRYKVNLICIPMSGLNVILSMDWLTANRVLIDCGLRFLIFPEEQSCVELISTRQVETSLGEKVSCFVLLGVMNVETKQSLQSIPIVRKFLEIFLKDIPGIPSRREVKFAIDLILGAEPVSVAPKELMELKEQIEDLMWKQMIRPSVSP
ncbi:uncharacterized protein LOC113869326 [Abrus precatorius]|uniref:Uncharacterized protein LOC113869326 n=1 Tax=Abrus precatorius TaxID=3816 RepID=A0A8B8M2I8_ABRPR|nr:uncharacterized protein LOC113869326 [Abrus precatorius]